MLHKQTATPELISLIQQLSSIPELDTFRLVGGTAVALHIGHRISVDIDFFSNQKTDKNTIVKALKGIDPDIHFFQGQYNIRTEINGVRIELYDEWSVPFRNEPIIHDGMRIATLNDLAAFKLEAINERREKKDYIDLYFIFKELGKSNVLEEYPKYNSNISMKSILFALEQVNEAEKNKSFMPELLTPVSWKEIQHSMIEAAKDYVANFQKEKNQGIDMPLKSNNPIKAAVNDILKKLGFSISEFDTKSTRPQNQDSSGFKKRIKKK